jgi:hypothetical protein
MLILMFLNIHYRKFMERLFVMEFQASAILFVIGISANDKMLWKIYIISMKLERGLVHLETKIGFLALVRLYETR